MKRPKKLKYPKRPKAGASSAVLANYIARKKKVDAENARRLRDYNTEMRKRATLRKQISR